VTRNNLHIIPGIDEFFSHLGSPLRSKKKDFIAYRLKDLTTGPYKNPAGSLRNLYYTISMLENDAFVYTVNNNAPQTSRPNTLIFTSPFHIYKFSSDSSPKGLSISFTDDFVNSAFTKMEFQKEFPFLWTNDNIFYLLPENAKILQELGQKILYEYENNHLFAENIIRDYLHIFLTEIKRIIHRVDAIVDNSAEYVLLQQFFLLVNNRYPLVRTVEHVAGCLSVTPARLWLAVKRLTGQTPSEIINKRILVEAQSLLRHSSLTVSEIADLLNFKEKSHFTRFFKNITGVSPIEYSRHSRLKK
jgi:AraC family transcriptional activator of pobA